MAPRIRYSKTGRVLTRRLEAFEYIHAENKKPYRHKFTRGTSVVAEPDGSLRIKRPDGKPSYEDVNPVLFAINTPKRRRKKGTRRVGSNRPRARKRASKRHRPNRAPRRAPPRRGRPVARKRKSGRRHHHGPVRAINRPRRKGGKRRGHNPFAVSHLVRRTNRPKRKSGRRHRFMNPPSLKTFGGHVVEAAKLGGLVFVGKVASGFVESFAYKIPGMTNLPAVGEAAVSIVASVAVGFLGTFISPNVGVALMAGGFEGVAENLAQTYLPATVQSMLGTGSGMSGYARSRVAPAGNVRRMQGYARAAAPLRGYAQRVVTYGG